MSTQELEKMRLDEHMQIPACLQQMLMQEWCTDVTLCCQGRRFRAHRVLLSACSTYLQEILWIHRKKTHATVILQDVQPEDMESLLCFLYSGEVTLPEERLESFISLAHQLKISVFIDKHLYEKSITLDRRRSSTETRDRRTATAPETNESPVTMETTGRSWDREKQSAMDQEKFPLNCDTKLITNDDEGGQSDVLKKSYLIAAQKLNSMSDYNSQFERYDQFLSRIDRSNPPVIFKDTTSPCQMSIKPESTDHNHNHHHHHQAHQAAAAFHCNVNYQHILSSISAGCLEQQSNDTDKLLVNPSGHNRLSQHEEHLLNYFHDQLNYGYNFVAGGSFRTSSLSKDKFTGPGDWPWIGAVAQGSWTRPKPQLLPVPIISPVVTGEKERCDGVPRSLKSSPGGILTPSPWAQNKVPWVGEIRRPTPKRPVVIPPRPPHDLPEPTPALPCEDIAVSLPCIIKPHIFSENLALSQNHKISPRRDLPIPATLVKINDKPTHHGDSGGGGRLRQETYLRLAPGSYENSQHPVVGDKTTQESVDFFRSNDRSPKPPFVAAEMSSAVSKSITHDQGCLFEVTSPSKDGCSSTENKSSTIEVTPDSGDSFNDTNNNCRFPFFTADDNRQKCKDVVAVTKGALAASGALTKLVCHTCKQQFASHVALEQHVASTHALDDDEKNLACAICKKSFEDKESWCADQKSHADASSSESAKKSMDHECTDCGKKFVTRASLKVHMRTHTGEKPFHCTECGKQFSQLRNYKYHRSVHEGTKEFAATCPECGKYFNDRGYLSSHMKIHRNRKEYGCEFCGKSFNQRVAYNMHVRIHTGEKPHVCPHCGKCFSRKMLLKQHLRIHTGEKPFQCVICQKAFADRSNMTLHMRLHSGVKPYTCTVCSKSFTKKHHLKTHMNYHTGVKPYSCQKCGLKFSQSSNMRTHYKKCVALPPKMVAPVNPMNSSSS